MEKNGLPKRYIILLHIAVWLIILQLLFDLSGLYYSFQELFFEKQKRVDDAFLLLPFLLLLFYWNSEFLLPKYFNRKNWWKYLIALTISFFVFIFIGNYLFEAIENQGYFFRIGQEEYMDANLMMSIIVLFASTSWGVSKIAFENAAQKKTAEEKQKEAELKFLNAQFNPHFLFNTLNGIYSLSAEEEAEQTTAAILKLSEIMRYPINEGAKKKVFLKNEISFLKNYIDLQEIRLGEDYPIHFELNDNMENAEIAPLLFIPFIENAFKYGVSQKSKQPINIDISLKNKELNFTCTNTIVKTEKIKSHELGLENIRSRLALLYPDKYTLEAEIKNDKFIVTLNLVL